jgi:hypothetical protein
MLVQEVVDDIENLGPPTERVGGTDMMAHTAAPRVDQRPEVRILVSGRMKRTVRMGSVSKRD